jgi:hypothetical protein
VVPGDDHQARGGHGTLPVRLEDSLAGAAADSEIIGGDNDRQLLVICHWSLVISHWSLVIWFVHSRICK